MLRILLSGALHSSILGTLAFTIFIEALLLFPKNPDSYEIIDGNTMSTLMHDV